MSSADATPEPQEGGFAPPSDPRAGYQPSSAGIPTQPPISTPETTPRFGAYGVTPAGELPTPLATQAQGETAGQAGAAASPFSIPSPEHNTQGSPAQPNHATAPTFGAPQPGYMGGPQTPPGYGSYAPGVAGFSLAPKPGIIPLRPLSVGEIISGAFEALRANPKAMFIPAFVVMGISAILTGIATYLGARALGDITSNAPASLSVSTLLTGSSGSLTTEILSVLLLALANTILTGLLIVAVSRSVLGRIATPGEVWQRTKGRILALIGQSLLIAIINTVVIGLVVVGVAFALVYIIGASDSSPSTGTIILTIVAAFAFLVAGVVLGAFLWVRLSMSSAALMLENIGIIEGIKRSWHLTRTNYWRVLGILLLSYIITGAASAAIAMVGAIFTGIAIWAVPSNFALITALEAVVSSMSTAIVLPFSSGVTALTYVDLRMRREGLDVELRQAAA